MYNNIAQVGNQISFLHVIHWHLFRNLGFIVIVQHYSNCHICIEIVAEVIKLSYMYFTFTSGISVS